MPLPNGIVPGSVDLSRSNVTQPGGPGTLIYINGNSPQSNAGFTPPPGIAPPRASNTNPAYAEGVYYSPEGFPDFSPYSIYNIRINMVGNHTSDFENASRAAGFLDTNGNPYVPDGYTWHHHEDGTTMMLVPRAVNNPRNHGWSHTGGRAIVNP